MFVHFIVMRLYQSIHLIALNFFGAFGIANSVIYIFMTEIRLENTHIHSIIDKLYPQAWRR